MSIFEIEESAFTQIGKNDVMYFEVSIFYRRSIKCYQACLIIVHFSNLLNEALFLRPRVVFCV